MRVTIQHIIYFFKTNIKRWYNLIFNRNAYLAVGDCANSDLDELEKANFKHHLKKYHYSRAIGPDIPVCYAPSRSIYFGFGGKVVPCCFNRDYIYGEYPDNTVKEIIDGKKRPNLQINLSEHNFRLGCEHCRSQIMSGNYEGVEARLYDKLPDNKRGPTEMIFELDNTCNLECVMCNGEFSTAILKNREGKSLKPNHYDDTFILQISPYLKYLKIAKFLGGEPFLIKTYYDIWEKLISVNPKCFINLQTNGTVYNEKIEDLLKRGKFQIGVSIDSLIKERFNKIRKNADLEIVLSNLDKFILHTRKSGSFVNISVCPIQQNWDEIPQIVNFCNKKGIYIYFNTVYTSGFDLRELSADKLYYIYNKYRNEVINGNSYIARRNFKFFLSLQKQIYSWYKQKNILENQERSEKEKYRLKHSFSGDKLAQILHQKAGNDNAYYKIILECTDSLPADFLLCDAHLDKLNDLKSNDVISALQNENKETIVRRLNNFIKHYRFTSDNLDSKMN